MDKFAHVDNVNGMKHLTDWAGGPNSTCNMINGTDGSAYPPGVFKDTTLYMFQADLCRSVPIVYEKEVNIHLVLLEISYFNQNC